MHYNQFNLYSHKFNIAKIYLDVDIYWLTVFLTCMKYHSFIIQIDKYNFMKKLYMPQKGLIFSERGPHAHLLSLKIRHVHFVAISTFSIYRK